MGDRQRVFDQHLAMRGTSHDRAPLAVRERMAIGPDRLPAALARLGTAASEVVIVSTCNRTEVYVWTGAAADGPALLDAFFADWFGLSRGDLDPTVQDLSGPDAVRHLFRVASGLESLVLGEPQILGQLRDALDHARAAGTAGPHLSRLVTEALRIGKRARSETGIARNRTSIAHAAIAVAARHPIGLAGRRVAVVGAGKMAKISVALLGRQGVAGVTVLNRTLDHAETLAAATGARARPLSDLAATLAETDVVVATAATDAALIGAPAIGDRQARGLPPLLLLDLGVPRNVDPAVRDLAGVDVVDVDDLDDVARALRVEYSVEITEVERLIAEAVAAFTSWHASRASVPSVAALRARADAIRQQELDRALAKLGHLSDRDQNVVRTLAYALVNKVLHDPVAHLGTAPPELRAHDAEAVRRLFRLDAPASASSPDLVVAMTPDP